MTLLHNSFQTEMIFFEQFKVPTIKFGKCFAEIMISIAVPETEFFLDI